MGYLNAHFLGQTFSELWDVFVDNLGPNR